MKTKYFQSNVHAENPIQCKPLYEKHATLLAMLKRELLETSPTKTRERLTPPKDHTADVFATASLQLIQTMDVSMRDRRNEKLKEVEAAIQRIKEDSYGECEECGERIAEKRLLAVPTARHCIECMEVEERRAKETASRDLACTQGRVGRPGTAWTLTFSGDDWE